MGAYVICNSVSQTSATDVLHALGAVPAGFREPTSSKLQTVNDKHTHKNYNTVKLSNSNLFYKDLFYNPQTQRVTSLIIIVWTVQLKSCDKFEGSCIEHV